MRILASKLITAAGPELITAEDKATKELQREAAQRRRAAMLGYKIMSLSEDKQTLVSLANNQFTFPARIGSTIRMPGKGIYMANDKQFVLDYYYSGGSDNEVLVTFSFDPDDIITGNLTDRITELSVPSAVIVGLQPLGSGHVDQADPEDSARNTGQPVAELLPYQGQCDALRRDNPEGEQFWREMIQNARPITLDDLAQRADVSRILDEDETLEEFVSGDAEAQAHSSTVDGQPVCFLKTRGFEFIFAATCPRKDRRTGRITAQDLLRTAAGPELIEKLVRRWPEHEAEIRELAAADPTGNLRWLDWAVKQVRQGADPNAVSQALAKLWEQRSLEATDIEPSQFQSLRDLEQSLARPSRETVQPPKVLYSKDGWTVTEVFDRAGLWQVSGTDKTDCNWCVGYAQTDRWKEYTAQPGWRLFVVNGPVEDAPYLAYMSGGSKKDEIADKFNGNLHEKDSSTYTAVTGALAAAGLEFRGYKEQHTREYGVAYDVALERAESQYAQFLRATNRDAQLLTMALQQAMAKDDIVFQEVVAMNPNTLPEILAAQARTDNYRVRWRVAGNPNTPTEALTELAQSDIDIVLWRVAANPNTSPDVLAALAESDDEDTLSAVAINPSTPPKTLAMLAKLTDEYVQRGVAKNPNTPANVRAWLIRQFPDLRKASQSLRVTAQDLVRTAAGPELIEKLVRRWPEHEAAIRELAAADPTGNLRWLDWGVKQLRLGADAETIAEVMQNAYARRDAIKDLTKFKTLEEAEEALAALDGSAEDRAETVLQENGWTVKQIRTQDQLFAEAGRNPTTWCVGWAGGGHWREYMSAPEAELFIIHGPDAQAPFLYYRSNGPRKQELKDRGNAAVDFDQYADHDEYNLVDALNEAFDLNIDKDNLSQALDSDAAWDAAEAALAQELTESFVQDSIRVGPYLIHETGEIILSIMNDETSQETILSAAQGNAQHQAQWARESLQDAGGRSDTLRERGYEEAIESLYDSVSSVDGRVLDVARKFASSAFHRAVEVVTDVLHEGPEDVADSLTNYALKVSALDQEGLFDELSTNNLASPDDVFEWIAENPGVFSEVPAPDLARQIKRYFQSSRGRQLTFPFAPD